MHSFEYREATLQRHHTEIIDKARATILPRKKRSVFQYLRVRMRVHGMLHQTEMSKKIIRMTELLTAN